MVQTINPGLVTAVYQIRLTIDGFTQSGASFNTPLIELNGTNARRILDLVSVNDA